MNRIFLLALFSAVIFPCFSQKQTDSLFNRKRIIKLEEVVIADKAGNSGSVDVLSNVDRVLRPVNSGHDLLRLVPGLFIAQHAGGGKAEQIFFRGFDADHGTDFAINVDGMPVNMVSHAHGHGYADFHFVIPETVDKLSVFKGPYESQFGDFATSGAADFSTKNKVERSILKLEGGQFDTYRVMTLLDLLQGKKLIGRGPENLYVAGEYNFSNGYFASKQNFNRYNLFAKYNGQISEKTYLTLSASTFSSSWSASGQVPERAVESGVIDRFGSLDDTEGGSTSRTNVNLNTLTALSNGWNIRNHFYYSHYTFNLFSNFTFFLNDSLAGDQINQKENGRNIFGYKFSTEKNFSVKGRTLINTNGIGVRLDNAENSLSSSVKRKITDPIVAGRVNQQNAYAYSDFRYLVTDKLTLRAALRTDLFHFDYRDNFSDSLSGVKAVVKVSPKLEVQYNVNDKAQIFFKAGKGFHSNDARSAVVSATRDNPVPSAYGCEVGSLLKPYKRILVNVALWALDLENELVYVGDEAIVEISGATRRVGADFALRYQLTGKLFADADVNFSHGRFVNLPEGENFIPLAPRITSTSGLSYRQNTGFNGALRYRYVDSRPANEDNSVKAKGYFLMDLSCSYIFKRFEAGITVENLLNTKWNEAQFDTESRLKDESNSVSELHFTPGTPLFLKGKITFYLW